MAQDAFERSGYAGEVECIDEQAPVAEFPAGLCGNEAPQLIHNRLPPPRRLVLERSKRPQFALMVDDLLDRVDTERTNQLILEVDDAGMEAERLH